MKHDTGPKDEINVCSPQSLSPRDKVNRFKAFVIGGGGFFTTKYTHSLVDIIETFSQRLTLPVIVLGAAARWVIVTTRFQAEQGAETLNAARRPLVTFSQHGDASTACSTLG